MYDVAFLNAIQLYHAYLTHGMLRHIKLYLCVAINIIF